MKLPLWYKDKRGKWFVIHPMLLQAVEDFPDGERGISHDSLRDALPHIDNVAVLNFWEVFTYQSRLDRYILK